MGYTIKIGNAVAETQWCSETYDEPYAAWYVENATVPTAPNSMDSGKTNERTPSYTGWADFVDQTGLREFFFDSSEGKMRRHPGCFKLTVRDAETVEAALRLYKEAHPDHIADICLCTTCAPLHGEQPLPHTSHSDLTDQNLVRLEWLAFWVRWAVDYCKRPAIWNL